MTTLTHLQKQYRRLCAQAAKMDQKRLKIQQAAEALKLAKSQVIQQIIDHKYLIDYCVITAQTPTQASLSRTREEIKAVVETHHNQYSAYDQFIFTSNVNMNNTIFSVNAAPLLSHVSGAGGGGSSIHIHNSNKIP